MKTIIIGRATNDELKDFREISLFHYASFDSETMLIDAEYLELKMENVIDEDNEDIFVQSEYIICFSAVDNDDWLMELLV